MPAAIVPKRLGQVEDVPAGKGDEGQRDDRGGNLGSDFGFFNFNLWDALKAHDANNSVRNKALETLNKWRNAIAHQDFDRQELDGRSTVRLADVRGWRRNCEELAVELDVVVGAHVGTITGGNPW